MDRYDWLLEALGRGYEEIGLLKEGPRGTIRLIRHRETGKRFILRRFAGSAEVYEKLRWPPGGRSIWCWRSTFRGIPWTSS